MLKSRPFSVSLVCLYLLISGTYYLIMSFAYLKQPATQTAMQQIALPYPIQVAMLYINLIVMVVTAIFMFEEANWARWVYLGWGFINIDYTLYIQTDWQNCMIEIAVYLVSAIILVVPNANRYFSSTPDYDY